MNFPKNLKFKDNKLSELIMKIENLYNPENKDAKIDYALILLHIDQIKLIHNYQYLIANEDLKIIELIQMEAYMQTNLFIEAFNNIGSFTHIEAFVSFF